MSSIVTGSVFSQATSCRSTYAAAQTPRTSGNWSPVNSKINDIIKNSGATVRARIRQLVRDFPYFARAVNTLVDYSVGSGIKFQSRVKTTDGSELDKTVIQQIEDSHSFWADEADASGQLHFYEMQRLAKRQDVETGEFLIAKKLLNDKSRYLPLALQMYEADWLTDMGANPVNYQANEISQGIEYNKKTGRIVAYHFTDPDSWGKTIRIDASNVIHGFRTLRPGQLRGVSDLVSAVMVAHDLSDLMGSEMDAAKMASKWMAIIKKTAPYPGMAQNVSTDQVTGNKIEELENAIIEYMRPGEDIELKSNPRPGTNFPPYVRLILTMISVSTNVPYELLTGDYQGLNFATGRIVRNDFTQTLRPVSTRHIRQFCHPSTKWFMDDAVLRGRLRLPGYYTNPARYMRAEWQPPGMESVDLGRETKAIIDQMNSNLRSPQEIARSRGRDLEDIYREIADAKQMATEHELTFGEVSTALANNPAAVDKQ